MGGSNGDQALGEVVIWYRVWAEWRRHVVMCSRRGGLDGTQTSTCLAVGIVVRHLHLHASRTLVGSATHCIAAIASSSWCLKQHKELCTSPNDYIDVQPPNKSVQMIF